MIWYFIKRIQSRRDVEILILFHLGILVISLVFVKSIEDVQKRELGFKLVFIEYLLNRN
jgi:hypothetical protein